MAINSVTDLRNTDAGQTAFTVRQSPVGGSTSCHAVQVTQGATSGDGAGVSVISNNSSAPAIRVRAAGPLIQLHDASGALQFEVGNTGAVTIASFSTTGNVTVGGTLGVTGASTLTGNVTMSGNASVTGTLAVTSTTTLTGAVTLTGGITGNTTMTGDFTIQGTNKAYRFRRGGSALDLEGTGVDLLVSNWSGTAFNGSQRSYMRLSADAQNIQVAGKVEYVDALYGTTRHVIDGAANTLGFHGATAVAKQTVSGSRGANAALADLLTKLATLGLITDGTTA